MLTIVIVIGITIVVRRDSEVRQLKKNHEVTRATIHGFGYKAGRSSATTDYLFYVGSQEYEGHFNHDLFCRRLSEEDKRILRSVKIPIVYLPQDPTVSRVLLRKNDYDCFKVAYEPSDGLKRILDTYINCD